MKRLAGIIALLFAATSSMLAGQPGLDSQERERVQQMFQEMSDRLALTPEQAEQVRPVLAGLVESMKAARDDYGGENQSRRSRRRMARELRAIRSHANERLKLILSKEQLWELRAMRKEWRDEFQNAADPGTR
jgi:hypothetical protein